MDAPARASCSQALTPGTRMLVLNSPNNPTGWTIQRAEQVAILEHCRRHGIWIVADDVYERLVYADGMKSAPSFLTLAETGDRLIVINSFSKAWSMTGWRLGWMVAPRHQADLAALLEYNISCVSEFTQRAAATALEQGEPYVESAANPTWQTPRRNCLPHCRTMPRLRSTASGRRDVPLSAGRR